ncbi:MAG TPA: hypothetical protein V6C86_09030 [Oculatellaceae cyanobacterium]
MTTATPSFDRTKAMTGTPGAFPENPLKQKLLKNKPLLGLGIVVLLLFSVGQFIEVPSHSKHAQDEDATSGLQAQKASQAKPEAHAAAINVAANGLDPTLATQFVTWWIKPAMDYSAATASRSHAQAFAWMTPQCATNFQQVFWTPQIAQEITQGHTTAAFQPISVQAEAINPDGTIVVGVTGTLIMQNSATPVSQQIVTDFLVKKEKDGLRIAGLYNRTTPQ